MGTRQEELDQIQREKDVLSKQENIMSEIRNLQRQIMILRKGFETAGWGEAVEEMDDVELEDVPEEEEVNG